MQRAEELYQRMKERGQAAIVQLIEARKCEELFLDFKESADAGAGNRLHDRDRNNLARAISGFGNSEGGVFLWGVRCSGSAEAGDLPSCLRPILDVRRFASWLEGAVSGCTVPANSGVVHHTILTDGEKGLAVTNIPKSYDAPHQVVGERRYYIRAGSSFQPVLHDVLAGMFGRRPQPRLIHLWNYSGVEHTDSGLRAAVGLAIKNTGRGLARDLYAAIFVLSVPGDNCELS